MRIENAGVVITGGASGLGLATVQRFLRIGAKVAVIDIAPEDKVRGALGERVTYCMADVRREDEISDAFNTIASAIGPISVLLNGAGKAAEFRRTFGRDGPYSLDLFRKIIDINLIGSFNCARLAAEHMARNEPSKRGERGVIINVSSITASDAPQGTVAYTAAKAGVQGMTLSMARDLAVFGIRVCAIAPGSFKTPMLSDIFNGDMEELLQDVPFPNDKLGDPDDFAMLAEQICTNPMLNGATLRIDGAARLS